MNLRGVTAAERIHVRDECHGFASELFLVCLKTLTIIPILPSSCLVRVQFSESELIDVLL